MTVTSGIGAERRAGPWCSLAAASPHFTASPHNGPARRSPLGSTMPAATMPFERTL